MSKLDVFVWLTVKWVCSFQTATLMSRRSNRFWGKGLACKASSVAFQQTSWCYKKFLRKNYSVPRDYSRTENYKQVIFIFTEVRRVLHWQFLITCIFFVSLKFDACYITGEWGEFKVKNTTSCFHIPFLAFTFMFLRPFSQHIVSL